MDKKQKIEFGFDPSTFESKWQKVWEEKKLFSPDLKNAKNPYYNLMMFPYPSAEGLHVGNMYTFTGADVYARFNRMQGKDVFEPIGLDGFGIHSENYALKVGRHPREQAEISEKNFYRQLRAIGNSFDWTKTLETYDPNYYKWTQWLFIQLFKAGLAYRKKAEVNWCPSCKTVLSDEQVLPAGRQVIDARPPATSAADEVGRGKCERCSSVVEKRDLEQWFFKITKYAQKLLDNLEKLDWTEKIKIAQKNWIGRSEGARIKFKVQSLKFKVKEIEVFTTRPDTLFGATFLVLSPEHPFAQEIDIKEVKDYVRKAQNISNNDRIAEGKDPSASSGQEKTGVFSGVYAINPVNNEKIPVWIADYVLMGYGTGAIMAVPAHDERDFEFAKKYNLPIKQVIMPENGNKHEGEERRDGGAGVIFDPKRQKYAVFLSPSRKNFLGLFAGGTEPDEDEKTGVLREVTEESGLHNFSYVEKIGDAYAHFYSGGRKSYRIAKASGYLVILENDDLLSTKLEEHEKFSLVWRDPQEILANWYAYEDLEGIRHWERFLKQGVARAIELGHDITNKGSEYKQEAYTGEGILTNSEEWNNLEVPKDMGKVIDWIEKKGIGVKEVNFHLRDWLISRQRYWGPPIPMIYCKNCADRGECWFSQNKNVCPADWNSTGWYPVPDENLPVLLPDVKDWKPMGIRSGSSGQAVKGPLANHPEFYETKCPECGVAARRETDVSDTFLDSAWYFLRYTSVDIDSIAFDREIVKKWLPVNMYIGGAEHAVLHLLYSRFVTMALHDLPAGKAGLKFVDFQEPFTKLFAHGLIIKDGAKMSKSRGNVVVPDGYIKKYGADTLRMYLMFIGPFNQGGDFSDSGIEGMHRFLKRIWVLFQKSISNLPAGEAGSQLPISNESLGFMHKTIKKVTEDISQFHYNTAISSLMEWYNFLDGELSKEEAEAFLKLLAPFAPHMTEELWQKLGIREKGLAFSSIHLASWPVFDEKYLVEDAVTIVIQVNGKKRSEFTVNSSQLKDQEKLESQAQEIITKYLEGKTINKTIYVPGKILNFVV